MSLKVATALVARNAKACEEAKRPTCRCRCGGSYHGIAHSSAWVAKEAEAVDREWEEKKTQTELGL